tara:strand:+ start:98 stop:607 length:510 start_codon:yes stop_codon:yes gene_type:complete
LSKKLTIQEKEEIRVLYRIGDGWSYDKLAIKFDCSKSTIKRIIKAVEIKIAPTQKAQKEEPQNQELLRSMDFLTDPIQFRIRKFHEISMSIDLVESRGNNPVQLHRLQLDIHDQITEKVREQNGGADIDNEDELLLMIQQAVFGMPPNMKEKLLETLSDDYSNVIPMEG